MKTLTIATPRAVWYLHDGKSEEAQGPYTRAQVRELLAQRGPLGLKVGRGGEDWQSAEKWQILDRDVQHEKVRSTDALSIAGTVLLLLGLIAAVAFWLFDTGVSTGMGDVHNLDRAQIQSMGMLCSCTAIFTGAIFKSAGHIIEELRLARLAK